MGKVSSTMRHPDFATVIFSFVVNNK